MTAGSAFLSPSTVRFWFSPQLLPGPAIEQAAHPRLRRPCHRVTSRRPSARKSRRERSNLLRSVRVIGCSQDTEARESRSPFWIRVFGATGTISARLYRTRSWFDPSAKTATWRPGTVSMASCAARSCMRWLLRPSCSSPTGNPNNRTSFCRPSAGRVSKGLRSSRVQ